MTYTARENLAHTLDIQMSRNGTDRDEKITRYYEGIEMPVTYDGTPMQMHQLLRSEALDGAALIREDIVKTINEGAQPAVAALSEMYYTFNTSSNKVKVPKGNGGSFGSYAAIASEGNGVTVDNNRVLYSEIDIIKPMSTVEITREMLQDAEFDLISREIAAAGARIGNTMQSIALYELITSADVSNETVTTAKTLKEAINAEIANIQKNGYAPDRIMLTPKAAAWLRDELTAGYYAGNDPMTTARVPTLYGIRCEVNPIAPATYSSYTYSPGAGTFGGTNGIGAIVYARDKAVGVAIRDPVGTDSPFNDIYKDLTAITATCRFGAGAIHKTDADSGDKAASVYISY